MSGTLYGVGSVLLTLAVLAPVLFAGTLGRPGTGSSILGERPRDGGPWRLLEAVPPPPDPALSENVPFALNLEFAVSRLDRSAIDANSVNDGDRDRPCAKVLG